MFEVLISLFGIAIVYRNLSLLEKFEVISMKKMFTFFIILQFPVFLFVFFKEQLILVLLYIGIFSITLIFYRIILMKLARITYEKCHLRVLDHLILLLKSGKSAQSSLNQVLVSFSRWEKLVFRQMESIFELKSVEKADYFELSTLFFNEIKIILRSSHRVSDQLLSFREGLKIRRNLRHKSRQVAQQIRAQALVAILIFALLVCISLRYLNLARSPEIIIVSTALFVGGLLLVFLIGGKIRWKT